MDAEKHKNGFYESVIIAGFGGQGIILAGKLLAQAALVSGKEVTFFPSYGAEVRGGTSNCTVVISNEEIASPVVTSPDSLIVMNNASMRKFAASLKPDGLLVYNSSLVSDVPALSKDIDVLAIPADEIANNLGSPKIANMVILGSYLQKRNLLSIESAANCLPEVLSERLHKTIPLNIKALQSGAVFSKSHS